MRKRFEGTTSPFRSEFIDPCGARFSNIAQKLFRVALIAFFWLAVTKLAHWPMSSLLLCGSPADSLLQLSFALALVGLKSV